MGAGGVLLKEIGGRIGNFASRKTSRAMGSTTSGTASGAPAVLSSALPFLSALTILSVCCNYRH